MVKIFKLFLKTRRLKLNKATDSQEFMPTFVQHITNIENKRKKLVSVSFYISVTIIVYAIYEPRFSTKATRGN